MPSKFITSEMTLVNQGKVFKFLASFSSFAALIAYAIVRSCFCGYPLSVADEVGLLFRLFAAGCLLSILLFSLFLAGHFIYNYWLRLIVAGMVRTGLQLRSYFGSGRSRQMALP